MILRMIVAGTNPNGEPDLFFCKVECSQKDYQEGNHYDAAKRLASDEDWEQPFVAFDEKDAGGKAMLDKFTWESASIVTVNQRDRAV